MQKQFFNRTWCAGVIGAALALVTGFLSAEWGRNVFLIPTAQSFQFASYDWPTGFQPASRPEEVVIVFMDDESHNVLKQPFNAPWDRGMHAELLDRLTAAGAKAVVFDIVFTDPGPDPEADRAFAEAIARNGRVVLAADGVPAVGGGRMIVPPHEPFAAVAAGIGSAELLVDADLTVRRHLPLRSDDIYLSLSWSAAELVDAPVTFDAGALTKERWIHYYGPPATVPHISYHVVFNEEFPPPEDFFRGKVVFVGARLMSLFAGDRKDEFRSPHSFRRGESRFIPGVEVHATKFLNLAREDWLRRYPPLAETCVILGAALLFGFGLARVRPERAALIALLSVAVIVLATYLLFLRQLVWWPWLIVAGAQIPVAMLWSVSFNSFHLYVERRLLEVSLAAHLSPHRARQLLKNPKLLAPGAEKQTVSIIFSDIANFSTISEGMDSDDLARIMNDYFEAAVGKCIHKTDGTVVKFIGDAIFAIWNAPEPQPDHQERACRAALLLRDQVTAFQTSDTAVELRTRIGLHTGIANVGNFGSAHRVDYTAIGESINLCSRLEGLNKFLGTDVLLTGDTLDGARGRFITRNAGRFVFKGFARAVEVHELLGSPDEDAATRARRESFEKGLCAFQQHDFQLAARLFQETIEKHPGDGPSQFYLRQIEEYRKNPPPPDWNGEVVMLEK